MASNRSDRINEEFRRELSDILQTEVKDPGLSAGMVSVVHTDVTRDLSHAKIYLSIYGTEKQKTKALGAVERATGFIKRELAARIQLRRMPELHFIIDNSIEYAVNISEKIDEVMSADNEE